MARSGVILSAAKNPGSLSAKKPIPEDGHGPTDPPTLREAHTRATAQLVTSAELRPTAAQDALVLLLHTAGLTRAIFYANPDRLLTREQASAYEAAIARRLAHEPIQYITGEQEFYGLPLHVTPAVLIPRPETEHLVESVLQELASHPAAPSTCHPTAPSTCHPVAKRRDLLLPSPLRILDIGTGSGAIAIALARHLPQAQVTAVDISPAALEIAAANAARHNLSSQITFLESDLLAGVPHSSQRVEWEGEWDAIVSNPPYVPLKDRDTLHPQVRDFEPSTALFAESDGLSVYRRLIPAAYAVLKPGRLLALEIGHGQRDALAELLSGWQHVRFVDDLQGIPRVALARKPK